ncbi:MAG: hypothetical protein NTZ42_01015, partial [Candidatus Gribaldobacteria bacterium]|nr:hypothetical protein [Candidatus Gribaldobacteria bacterium]
MEIDKQEAKEEVQHRHFYAFVPHRLEIASKPEWNNFPFNVVFMSFKIKDGKQISGTALYEPDFDTYQKDGCLNSMRYHNAYGGDCHLIITYDEEKKKYHGEKFVNGELVVSADGADNWRMFFVHLTLLGVAN